MKQLFLDGSQSFSKRDQPYLAYVSKVEAMDLPHPRILHSHKDIVEIILITSGHDEIFIDANQYPIKKGDLLIYNSGVVHDELFQNEKNPIALYCVGIKNIHEEQLPANSLIPESFSPIFATKACFDLLMHLFSSIFLLVDDPFVHHEIAVQNILAALLEIIKTTILADTVSLPNRKNEESAILQSIKRYIDQHFSEPIQLQYLEENWHISRYYLSHKFKEAYGYSTIDYLNRRRIGEAQTLLLNTKKTITEISLAVGFNSAAYFNNVFKRNVSLTPKEYRKRYLK